MSELAFQIDTAKQRRGIDNLDKLAMGASHTLLGALGYDTPASLLATLIAPAERMPTIIPFPGTYRPSANDALTTSSPAPGSVFQLKITLRETKPPIWRRVLVASDISLAELHEVILAAFGWLGYHRHDFTIGGRRYGVPDPDWDFGPPTIDERSIRLDSVAEVGKSFDYTYDFGDYWQHKVTVEKVLDDSATTVVPALIGGRRACPPEDCGGPWGYRELLAILADSTHPEHEARIEWLGAPFDPERFDPTMFEIDLQVAKDLNAEF